ncbi:hypothetical protein MRX96_022953 [Rhipicephalus microplus]
MKITLRELKEKKKATNKYCFNANEKRHHSQRKANAHAAFQSGEGAFVRTASRDTVGRCVCRVRRETACSGRTRRPCLRTALCTEGWRRTNVTLERARRRTMVREGPRLERETRNRNRKRFRSGLTGTSACTPPAGRTVLKGVPTRRAALCVFPVVPVSRSLGKLPESTRATGRGP